MANKEEKNVNFNTESLEKEPINFAEGIYWVGYSDENRGLHCNPYLISEGDEAVLIDGGNRDDFSTVMLKILRTGLQPSQINRLIYQHYDPDLCGSLPQLEAIINNDALRIISHKENNVFIHYYSAKTEKLDFRELDNRFEFKTGRRLEFYPIPYCHHPGSFVTYDVKTKTLFTSDLFGSFDTRWKLTLDLDESCRECNDLDKCPLSSNKCPLSGIVKFHQRIMTSNRALENTLNIVEKLDIDRIAPQHGSIIASKEDVNAIIRLLRKVKNVGIDYFLSEEYI
ncbi:MAG: MBL fold metallo-hydrolase [Clostridiales bacterium]|jgi:flavorubredoxin|nr:MBL fold metallo-hydrolase [Clostridiales bacterium]